MAHLLLVEDDDAIAVPLERTLTREGYAVRRVGTGEAALQALAAAEPRPALVILDLGLPGIDGLEVCRRLRERHHDVPVLMLTARAEELDAVVGLDMGADDYLTKPFSLAELLARIRALLRRGGPAPATVGAMDGIRIDAASRRVWVDDAEVELTPKEYGVLELLAAHEGQVLSRERLMEEVWDVNWFGSTKTLDMTVARLRRKLGARRAPAIQTVRGVGYRMEQT